MRCFFRGQRIVVAAHHLQLPQPVGKNQEDGEDDILRRRQANRGNFFVAAKHQLSVASCQLPVRAGESTLGRNVSLSSLE
jgi:hypothetical protein